MSLAVTYTAQMLDVIASLRRRLGDIGTTPVYSTELLYSYVADAVAKLQAEGIQINVEVYDGDFVDANHMPVAISHLYRQLFALEAAILLKAGQKSQSDGTSVSIRRNDLSVSSSSVSREHRQTLEMWQREKSILLYRVLMSSFTGGRIE